MKYIAILVFTMACHLTIHAQFVAQVMMKEEIEGICDHDKVYALFNGLEQQIESKCETSKEEMQEALNGVSFFQENPKYKVKDMATVFVNCEGEAVSWSISGKTNETLKKQLLAVFETFNKWSPGKLYGDEVDSHVFVSFKIKKGILVLY